MKYTITPRELEILRSTADGFDESKIANDLMLKKSVVVDCRKKVLKRIGANNALEAIQLLAKSGFSLNEQLDETQKFGWL